MVLTCGVAALSSVMWWVFLGRHSIDFQKASSWLSYVAAVSVIATLLLVLDPSADRALADRDNSPDAG